MVHLNSLYDIWRLYNSDQKDFTWKHQRRPILRRIDYMLCNDKFLDKIVSSYITDMPNTDHRAVIVDASYNIVKKGSGFWKFNNSLLKRMEYVDMINRTLDKLTDANIHPNPQVVWDCCKNTVKQETISYCSTYKHLKNTLQELKQSIDHCSKLLAADPHNAEIQQRLCRLKLEYDNKNLTELKGAQIRSKVKWV